MKSKLIKPEINQPETRRLILTTYTAGAVERAKVLACECVGARFGSVGTILISAQLGTKLSETHINEAQLG